MNRSGLVFCAGCCAMMLWVAPGAATAQELPSEGTIETTVADPLLSAIGERMSGTPAQSPPAQRLPASGMPSYGGLLFRLAIALALTLGALYGAIFGLKQVLGRKGLVVSPHVRVISRSQLSSKSAIYLVEVAGQTLVLGETPSGLNLLSTVQDPRSLAATFQPRAAEGELPVSGRGRVAEALSSFAAHWGASKARLNARHLGQTLRQGTQAARALAERIGFRQVEDAVSEFGPRRQG